MNIQFWEKRNSQGVDEFYVFAITDDNSRGYGQKILATDTLAQSAIKFRKIAEALEAYAPNFDPKPKDESQPLPPSAFGINA